MRYTILLVAGVRQERNFCMGHSPLLFLDLLKNFQNCLRLKGLNYPSPQPGRNKTYGNLTGLVSHEIDRKEHYSFSLPFTGKIFSIPRTSTRTLLIFLAQELFLSFHPKLPVGSRDSKHRQRTFYSLIRIRLHQGPKRKRFFPLLRVRYTANPYSLLGKGTTAA